MSFEFFRDPPIIGYVTFQTGAHVWYGQDLVGYRIIPTDVEFAVQEYPSAWKLTAPGYGGNPPGNGALLVSKVVQPTPWPHMRPNPTTDVAFQ